MIVGQISVLYSTMIELKCNECEQQFSQRGRTRRSVTKFARLKGWWVHGDRALCPKHKQIQTEYRKREHGRASA